MRETDRGTVLLLPLTTPELNSEEWDSVPRLSLYSFCLPNILFSASNSMYQKGYGFYSLTSKMPSPYTDPGMTHQQNGF